MAASLLKSLWLGVGLLVVAACTTGSTSTTTTAAGTTAPSPLVDTTTTVSTTSTTLSPVAPAAPRLEVWMVPGHGTPPDLGPFFAVLDDGTIYIRDFRAEVSGPDPVWTGRLADPSLVESLVVDLPRGGNSTFGIRGMDGATLIVVLDGEPITALWGPWNTAQDPTAQQARELAIQIIYDQLASPGWWEQPGLLEEPLRPAELDRLVGQASEFIDQLPQEARRTAVRTPWPGELPNLEGPRAFECFVIQGAGALEVDEILTTTEQQVLWVVGDIEFFTVRERWLLPYETPCEPNAPPITARLDE